MWMSTIAVVLSLATAQVPAPTTKPRVKEETGRPLREVLLQRGTELAAGSACGVGGLTLAALGAVGVAAAVVGLNVARGNAMLDLGSIPLQVPVGNRDDRLMAWVLLAVPLLLVMLPLGELAGFTAGALLINGIPWPGTGVQRLGRASLAPLVGMAVTTLSMGAFGCLGVYGFSLATLQANGTFAGALAAALYLLALAILLPPAGLLLGSCTLGVCRPAAMLSASVVEAWTPDPVDDGG
jgi:hypothetical protein